VWLVPDVVTTTSPVKEVEEVVEVVELVGSGRGLKFEVDRDDERDGQLVVAEKGELGLEPGEVSDEPVVIVSRPLTAQAQMGGEVADITPHAKPVHELDSESSSF
jgi:hypothetical protein